MFFFEWEGKHHSKTKLPANISSSSYAEELLSEHGCFPIFCLEKQKWHVAKRVQPKEGKPPEL